MNFNLGSMEIVDAISMYSTLEQQKEKKNDDLLTFYRMVSFIVTLLKNGKTVPDIKAFKSKQMKDGIPVFVDIIRKDIRCVLVNDEDTLDKLTNYAVGIKEQDGGAEDAAGSASTMVGSPKPPGGKETSDTSSAGIGITKEQFQKSLSDVVKTLTAAMLAAISVSNFNDSTEYHNFSKAVANYNKNAKELGDEDGLIRSFLNSLGIKVPDKIFTVDAAEKEINNLITKVINIKGYKASDLMGIFKLIKIGSSSNTKYNLLWNYENEYKKINFYKKDNEGKWVDVEKEDPGVVDDFCTGDCLGLMQKCLIGQNINECKEFMKNSAFYGKAAEAVKKMPIDQVIKFLNAYKVNINDRTNKVEDAGQYMWRLHNYAVNNNDKNFNINDWNAINQNTALKAFINYLVDKYNEYNVTMGSMPQKGHYGVSKVPPKSSSSSPQYSYYLRNVVKRKLDNYSFNLGLGNMYPFESSYFLSGGGKNETKYLSNLLMNGGADLPFDSIRIYEQSLKTAQEILKQHNSELDSEDEKEFHKLIEETRKSLYKISEIHDIASIYASLLINHAINDGEKVNDIINMKRLIDKHSKSVNKLSSLNLKGANIVTTIEKATSPESFNGASFK